MIGISDIQLEANRNNAKLGGVKTMEGKEKIKNNAIKHGLLSSQVILNNENKEELLNLENNFLRDFNPKNQLEAILVDRIISNTWRLRRVLNIERNVLSLNKAVPFKLDLMSGGDKNYKEIKEVNDMMDNVLIERLLRYETTLERGLFKALHELQRLIAQRNGEIVTIPVAVDLEVTG